MIRFKELLRRLQEIAKATTSPTIVPAHGRVRVSDLENSGYEEIILDNEMRVVYVLSFVKKRNFIRVELLNAEAGESTRNRIVRLCDFGDVDEASEDEGEKIPLAFGKIHRLESDDESCPGQLSFAFNIVGDENVIDWVFAPTSSSSIDNVDIVGFNVNTSLEADDIDDIIAHQALDTRGRLRGYAFVYPLDSNIVAQLWEGNDVSPPSSPPGPPIGRRDNYDYVVTPKDEVREVSLYTPRLRLELCIAAERIYITLSDREHVAFV